LRAQADPPSRELANGDFGAEIHFVIERRRKPILPGQPVLTHHDDRDLHRRAPVATRFRNLAVFQPIR
jgi:hypothetical protein